MASGQTAVVVRVLSWNIEHGRNIEQAIEEIRSTPELDGTDIVLVQEMHPDAAERLAEGLGMGHHFDAVADSCVTGLPFGNAVMSRWPLSDFETIPLPGVAPIKPQPRCAVHATVDVDGTVVSAISAHLETAYMRRSGRSTQARAVAQHRMANRPVATVVGGDFNSASALAVSATDRVMTGAGLHRATNRADSTFRRFGLSFTLDHIYARGADGSPWSVAASGVVRTASASDHQPIWAELQP